MIFTAENKIIFMQDFGFYKGIPSGIDFEMERKGNDCILRAPEYGRKPYGNGALFVKWSDLGWPGEDWYDEWL